MDVLFLFCSLSHFLLSVSGKTIHIFVSPHGSDSNTGLDVNHPLKTLHKAKDLLEKPPVKGNRDLVYQKVASKIINQKVEFTGGVRLPTNLFHTVTDKTLLNQWTKEAQKHIRQIHLPEAGITDVGSIHPFGWYVYRKAALELFINGKPLTLARYPNHDYIDITSKTNNHMFSYSDNRDSRWVNEKEPWAYGYWFWSWSDMAVKINHIDTKTHTITLQENTRHGIRPGEYRTVNLTGGSQQGGYFRVFNMLSELDEPGEYFIDRTTGMLYVWPITDTGTLSPTDVVYASMLDNCTRLDPGVSNLRFEDFTLEACREFGISATNVNNIQLSRLELKNTGSFVFQCSGDCRSVTVSRCEIHDGDGGIDIFGGDRVTLTSSGNVIEDNHIWKYSREGAVGQNAVHSVGVNNIIRYNHIHDGQYAAVKFDGNDHLMEYNHVHHNCMNASDCGAFHATRSWTYRGNIIRNNHIHNNVQRVNGAPVRGVMLDDQYSTVTIEHNVFYHNEIHANIGGGRDNIIRYNVMYNATQSSMQVDGRGATSQFDFRNRTLSRDLSEVPYTNALWTAKYPQLAVLYDGIHVPRLPEGNKIYKNIIWNEKGLKSIFFTQVAYSSSKYFDVHDNHEVHHAGDFYSPDDFDFRPRCSTKQWADGANFELPVSINAVGPRYTTGPTYLHKVLPTYPSSHPPKTCDTSTFAPATTIPGTPYISDGSGPNVLYPNITEGCWLVTEVCHNHPVPAPLHRDTWGEQHEQAGSVEEKCLGRAAKQWHFCGSNRGHEVKAVFGPTGAMTIAGWGCYMSFDTCPRHVSHFKGIQQDSYAEREQNATTDVEGCLSRARAQWHYCGSDPQYPVTSIFGATGEKRTSGAGCWINIVSCPADKTLAQFFYDAWGATNLNSDTNEDECFQRATDYWQYCGSHHQYPVTAYFRPYASHRTVPVISSSSLSEQL